MLVLGALPFSPARASCFVGSSPASPWNLAYASVYSTTSYIKQNTVIRAECNIYNVKDEKLIWSGESDTMLEKSFEKMGEGYAQSLLQPTEKRTK